MSELSPPAVVKFPQKLKPPGKAPDAPSCTNQPLPRLDSPPDQRFLHYEPHVAGRAVVLELYAPENATAAQRIALWGRHAREGVDLRELGLCAQALERAHINWRQADSVEQIVEAAHRLTQDVVAD